MRETLREIMALRLRRGRLGHDTVTGFDFTQDEPLIRSKAIRAKCIECQNGQLREITDCQMSDCSLWPYRSGRKVVKGQVKARPNDE